MKRAKVNRHADTEAEASNDVAKALKLKTQDPALLAAYAAVGPTAGDVVFADPLVKGLLATARTQVFEALKKQKGPEHEKWLICVRTYGRARPTDDSNLDTFIRKLCRKMDKAPGNLDRGRWIAAFAKAGVTSTTDLAAALRKPAEFHNRLVEISGETSRSLKLIERFARVTNEHGAHFEAKGVERGILNLTLAALELALGGLAHERCLVFVSHEDPDYLSGNYHEALAGTPWQKRIVVGVKGAHHQVRFIEEAAPRGTHLVVADDNIDSIVVEIANDKNVPKFRVPATEGKGCKTRCLQDHESEDVLDGTGLQAVPEDCLQWFLRAADQRFNAKAKAPELQMLSQTLNSLGITTPERLVENLSQPKKTLDKRLRKLARKNIMDKLKAQLKRGRLPVRRWVVKAEKRVVSKANVEFLRKPASARLACKGCSPSSAARDDGPELASLIRRAGREMNDTGANVWSVSPSKNSQFLHGSGEELRRLAKKNGFYQDISSSLGLLYGAFFGFRALQDPERYTRFGQIKDDVERSLRYWHKDGIILRFKRYAVCKAQKPGKFLTGKGGISAGSSEEAHKERGHQNLKAILDDFALAYARFPKDGEKCGDCGLIWEASKKHQLRNQKGCKKRLGTTICGNGASKKRKQAGDGLQSQQEKSQTP